MRQYSEMTIPELRSLYYSMCQRQIVDFEEMNDLNIENGGLLMDEVSERTKKLVAIRDELMKRGFTERAYQQEHEDKNDDVKTNVMECDIDGLGRVVCIQNGDNCTQIGFIESLDN